MPTSPVAATHRIAGRVEQLRQLEAVLASPEPEFLAMYGRRRVGKTFLVRAFFEGRTLFFELTGRADGTLRDHLRLFAESLSEAFSPGVRREPPRSWHEAFQALWAAIEPLHAAPKHLGGDPPIQKLRDGLVHRLNELSAAVGG